MVAVQPQPVGNVIEVPGRLEQPELAGRERQRFHVPFQTFESVRFGWYYELSSCGLRSDLMTRIPCVLVMMAASACAPRSNGQPSAESSAASSAASAYAITLYHSPCYARCPVYSASVTPEGAVTYEGRQNVLRRGTETSNIPRARVEALVRELAAAGYFEFADRYRPSEPVCGRYVPDAPTVITSVTLGGRAKRIEHDHGCGSAPLALRVLESRIDEVLGTGRWTGR